MECNQGKWVAGMLGRRGEEKQSGCDWYQLSSGISLLETVNYALARNNRIKNKKRKDPKFATWNRGIWTYYCG